MAWRCKLCSAAFDKRAQTLEHYRLRHSSVSSVSQLPCLHDDCVSTFQSVNALKIHISRIHTQTKHSVNPVESVSFVCPKCGFKQPFNYKTMLGHLRAHLKNHEMLDCPFKNCHYRSNVYSSFNAHRSRDHPDADAHFLDFKNDIILTETENPTMLGQVEAADSPENPPELESPDYSSDQSSYDTGELQAQLKSNLSSLFLKMQCVLHVSETAIQDIIDNLVQIFLLSKPLVRDSIMMVLQEHEQSISDVLINELVEAVMKSNVLVSATEEGAELSTAKRRKTFVRSHYPLVLPVQYTVGLNESTVVYVPVLQMLQAMFKNTDVLQKIQETNPSPPGMYMSHEDGTYFQENQLLSEAGELKFSLILYVDDLEIANPLGTSRKIHKLCAVYWLLANLPSKYRSSLHVIQLALLCKVSDVQRCGYESILSPLLKDLQTLEQDGIFIETLGRCVRGTVLCVAADNLAAHGLAGFVQSFRGQYVCRFCCCSTDQIQISEVSEGEFSMRTKETHDLHVQNVVQGENEAHFGVVDECPLSKALQHFHTVTGFPPDILHDLFEGVVPVELALCIREMIRLKYFTLEYLNTKIRTFPYQHFDKVDKPQPIPKNFVSKLSIGGNGHENCTLLRLLPLMIGSKVPEGDETWAIIMDLKEIVQLVLSPSFTEESIQYMQSKITDHRQALKAVFPDFKLRPKHHFIEHYPKLTKCFGPLVHLWTMRFEGKHRFFKRVIHDTQNFKNVLKTLANRHQLMMAFHLNAPSFFKPQVQATSVTSVQVATLPQVAKDFIKSKTDSQNIYNTSVVSVHGTDYANGMFVSVGQAGGLPNFCRIERILLVNNSVSFLCRSYECWYIEHLRSFKLTSLDNFSVHELSDLNDTEWNLRTFSYMSIHPQTL
ncbi:uncharacterized protein [Paramisgurnus dabryanus]|uniref:uncharacterized protein isoform X1 n=1 Tax=Paramisgurnus dabryanus TaxID=90735 RepID=UPI0031F375A1